MSSKSFHLQRPTTKEITLLQSSEDKPFSYTSRKPFCLGKKTKQKSISMTKMVFLFLIKKAAFDLWQLGSFKWCERMLWDFNWIFLSNRPKSHFIFLNFLGVLFWERETDLLFHLFMHSLVDSRMCPDQEWNLQRWHVRTTLQPTEHPAWAIFLNLKKRSRGLNQNNMPCISTQFRSSRLLLVITVLRFMVTS